MVKIGMVIGDRYEILGKIGTGGMSDVYKAKCHKLNRFVAVKVLKQEFSENENFVSKFKIEAQAAAGLMHPNIVNVYDVGEENGIHYIVMELVEGITLKKYIERKQRLSYKEAVSIGIQVCMGIDAAHKNHIIHRDIKPQNIIISKDGKVKVTDFGIAKAATSNTITSNVMGSVHYTSPEQARGGYSDAKSDVYSLGITLFEMLTGRVPFNGETTVAIAIKHIQEEMVSPREFVPDLPESVEGIVMKCCQKSPDRRYQNMEELVSDLKQSLINPDENIAGYYGNDTDNGQTRAVSGREIAEIKRQTGRFDAYEETGQDENYEDYPEEEYYGEEYGDDGNAEDDDDDFGDGDFGENDTKMERVTTILAILFAVVVCILILGVFGKMSGFFNFDDIGNKIDPTAEKTNDYMAPAGTKDTSEPSYEDTFLTEMPDIIGLPVEEAKEELEAKGFYVKTEEVIVEPEEGEEEVQEGIVISADIDMNERVPINTVVTIYVSCGMIKEAPDLINMTYDEAYTLLSEAGFLVTRKEAYSGRITKGRVLQQDPVPGSELTKDTQFVITISLGMEEGKVCMPNLVGRNVDEAILMIAEAGLTIHNVFEVEDGTAPPGVVVRQNFAADSFIEPGAMVDIWVSAEKQMSTYNCNTMIAAPTPGEAPDYVSGTQVHLTLVADDGTTILDMDTASFPLSANYHNLSASAGAITMTYKTNTAGAVYTDPETGELVVGQGSSESKTFTRRIEFVKEG